MIRNVVVRCYSVHNAVLCSCISVAWIIRKNQQIRPSCILSIPAVSLFCVKSFLWAGYFCRPPLHPTETRNFNMKIMLQFFSQPCVCNHSILCPAEVHNSHVSPLIFFVQINTTQIRLAAFFPIIGTLMYLYFFFLRKPTTRFFDDFIVLLPISPGFRGCKIV